MWYWREANFCGLRELAIHLAEEPELKSYSDYCLFREQGLRPQAFAALAGFIASTKLWKVEQRRAFVRWLIETGRANPNVTDLIPYPLQKFLVEPTLKQWQMEVPTDPVPFRLGWDRHSLKIAVCLDPTHQNTVLRQLKILFGSVHMACHELPAGIIGGTNEVLSDLDEVEVLLPLLADSAVRSAFCTELAEYREIAQNYSSYLNDKRQGASHAECFEAWAMSRGLKCTTF